MRLSTQISAMSKHCIFRTATDKTPGEDQLLKYIEHQQPSQTSANISNQCYMPIANVLSKLPRVPRVEMTNNGNMGNCLNGKSLMTPEALWAPKFLYSRMFVAEEAGLSTGFTMMF